MPHHDTNTMEAKIEEIHIYIVEEEFLYMASQDALLSEGYDPSSAVVGDGDPGKEEGAHGCGMTIEHKNGGLECKLK
jgi:hypothetical protein